MDNMRHNFLNNLFIDNLFDFNNYCLIIDILGFTIIIGIIIIYSKPFQEDLRLRLH